jgi:hypothetical protein
MKIFPEHLKPENKDEFPDILKERYLSYLREETYNYILRNNEQDFVDIHSLFQKRDIEIKPSDIEEMAGIMVEELQNLGWKTELIFNKKGLIVYHGDKVPIWGSEFDYTFEN